MSTPVKTALAQVESILTKLVGFDTISCNSNRTLIDYVRGYLDDCGVASEIVAEDQPGKACLWATIGRGEKGVMIAGHSDVVPVEGQDWTSDPFTLSERAGKLYGRGAADMKGFIACALAFIPEFLATDAGCFHLALTYDEETSMAGATRLAEHLGARGVQPDWVWIGEPTGLTIVDQHKGVAAYDTLFTGVPGHSGQPDKGLNAIQLAWEFIDIINEQARQKRENPYFPSRFDPPYTSFNLGVIRGGTAENIIAGQCDLRWQVRTHPGDDIGDIAGAINARAHKTFAARFAAFAPQARMDTCVSCCIPPFVAQADNKGAARLKKALLCDETHAVGFATEAGIFQKLGAGAVVCGPGFIEQAHQPDEYIDKSQLAACVDLLRAVLLSSCAPEKA